MNTTLRIPPDDVIITSTSFSTPPFLQFLQSWSGYISYLNLLNNTLFILLFLPPDTLYWHMKDPDCLLYKCISPTLYPIAIYLSFMLTALTGLTKIWGLIIFYFYSGCRLCIHLAVSLSYSFTELSSDPVSTYLSSIINELMVP